jgi:hypothetical protein
MRIATIGASMFLAIGAIALCGAPVTAQSDAQIFPMQKGTRWIYRGEIAWQAAGEGAKVHTSRLDWKMEIVDSVLRGRYKEALVLGHPSDLTWYEDGREPGCYILIGVDDRRFYLNRCKPFASREKLMLSDGDLNALIDEEHLILKFPLRQGDSFGNNPGREVNDGMYAWFVQAVRKAALFDVRGVSSAVPRTEYVLTYQTNPDHQIDTYVPGIGLTAYTYSHHGTVSEVNVKLVEFHSPGQK